MTTTDKTILDLAKELRFYMERAGQTKAGNAIRSKAIAIVLRGKGKCRKPCCNYGDPTQAVFEFAKGDQK